MSRRDGRSLGVTCDGVGEPTAILLPGSPRSLPVLARLRHWREWIGSLEGEPERDIWIVETERGICELHCLRACPGEEEPPEGGEWVLARWKD